MSIKILRNKTIDSLRGIAIVTMVIANLAGEHLKEPHPLWFRYIGTFAAPLFITLSGMMIMMGIQAKSRPFLYFLKRGLWILAIAACLDVFIWGSYPFTCVDVLYLIGVATPLTYVFAKLPNPMRWIAVIGIVVLSIPMRHLLGYCDVPTLVSLSDSPPYLHHASAIWRHWIIDGWFPIFPWIAFMLLGVQLESIKTFLNQHLKYVFIIGSFLCVGGILALSRHICMVRDGYSELFYPLGPSFFGAAIGCVLILYAVFQRYDGNTLTKILARFGKRSLFMYITHLVISAYLIPHEKKVSFLPFSLYIGLTIIGLWGCAVILDIWNDKSNQKI